MVGVPKRIPTLFKFNSWLTIIESKDHGPTSYKVCPYTMVHENNLFDEGWWTQLDSKGS